MSEHHLSEITFDTLGLEPSLVEAVATIGFSHCTPIQAQTLPLALAGQDVLGQAQTGTGKTAAFLLAALNRLLTHPVPPGRRPNQPRALIVAPTRELALQIHKDAEQLAQKCGLRMVVVFGGAGYDTQREAIAAGVDVLIGTPGRLIDYFKQHIFDLTMGEVLVLDEADRMFDLGFIKDIRFLMRRLPPPERRLSMMFSATLPLRVTELAYEHMNNPKTVTIESAKITAARVREVIYAPGNDEKIPLLLGILQHMDPHRTIVFVNTKRAAERVWGYLEANGIPAAMLSGDVPQAKRMRLLEQFQQGELAVLVATDVAARGLHIPDVSHVINYDLPQDAEDYVHRVGRTARAGASGDAISFACEEYAFSLSDIEAYLGYAVPRGRFGPELLATDIKPRKRSEYKPAPPGRGRPPRSSGGQRRSPPRR